MFERIGNAISWLYYDPAAYHEVRHKFQIEDCNTLSGMMHDTGRRWMYSAMALFGIIMLPLFALFATIFTHYAGLPDFPVIGWGDVGRYLLWFGPFIIYWACFSRVVYVFFRGHYIIDRLHLVLVFLIENFARLALIFGIFVSALQMLSFFINLVYKIFEFVMGE